MSLKISDLGVNQDISLREKHLAKRLRIRKQGCLATEATILNSDKRQVTWYTRRFEWGSPNIQ